MVGIRQVQARYWGIIWRLGFLSLIILLHVFFLATRPVFLNTRGALGLLLPGPSWLVGLVFLLLSLILLGWSWRVRGLQEIVFWSAGVGGSMNALSRLVEGGVPDYLSFLGIRMNVPDLSLTLAGVLLVIDMLRQEYEQRRKRSRGEEEYERKEREE